MSRGGANRNGRGGQRARSRPLALSDVEHAQLERLVNQAFALRETPYLTDACAAIEAWFWETRPDRLERAARANGAAR